MRIVDGDTFYHEAWQSVTKHAIAPKDRRRIQAMMCDVLIRSTVGQTNAVVAQPDEQGPFKPEDAGSTPVGGTAGGDR